MPFYVYFSNYISQEKNQLGAVLKAPPFTAYIIQILKYLYGTKVKYSRNWGTFQYDLTFIFLFKISVTCITPIFSILLLSSSSLFCFVISFSLNLFPLLKYFFPLTFLFFVWHELFSSPLARSASRCDNNHFAFSREQLVPANSKSYKDTPNKGIATRDKCATREWPMNLGSTTCSWSRKSWNHC